MKRKTAKELLAESFLELAQKTNIEKITIQDIVDNCGYSPATFYRNFRDKYDLIGWYHAEQMAKIMDRVESGELSMDESYTESARYYEKNRKYLANLFQHTSGLDAFVRNMTDINVEVYKDYLRRHYPEVELDEKTTMMLRLHCLGASRLVSEWVLGDYAATAEELAEVIERSFPLELP